MKTCHVITLGWTWTFMPSKRYFCIFVVDLIVVRQFLIWFVYLFKLFWRGFKAALTLFSINKKSKAISSATRTFNTQQPCRWWETNKINNEFKSGIFVTAAINLLTWFRLLLVSHNPRRDGVEWRFYILNTHCSTCWRVTREISNCKLSTGHFLLNDLYTSRWCWPKLDRF